MCKTPWLRYLVIWEVINCDLQGQIELWAFSAVRLLWHGWACPTCTTSTTLPWKPDTSCYYPTKATWFIRFTLVFAHAPSAVSHCVLTAICNENRELSQTTPEATTGAPETPHQQHFYSPQSGEYSCYLTGTTLPLVLGVRQRWSRCWNWLVPRKSYCRIPSSFTVLTVSQSPSSACTNIPRPLNGPDWSRQLRLFQYSILLLFASPLKLKSAI